MATIRNGKNSIDWLPEEIITGTKLPNSYACFVINRQVTIPEDIVEVLWQNAECRCTVDGGTNRWKEFLESHDKKDNLKLPDYITGDFDSLTKDTSDFFDNPLIRRIHTPDQSATDFSKAISLLQPLLLAKSIKDIVVFHDTSGRLDHIIANLSTLFRMSSILNIYLLGGNSITWVLRPGVHTIKIPEELVEKQRWCSLLPIGGKSIVTTDGLKWNLNEDLLSILDGIVSSSNTYMSSQVCVKTSANILWSMGVYNFHD